MNICSVHKIEIAELTIQFLLLEETTKHIPGRKEMN